MISEQMIANAARYAHQDCTTAPAKTPMANLSIYSARQPTGPTAALFEPRFYVLLQGSKRMTIAGRDLLVRPGDCAVSTLGLPFHTEVIEASPDSPYLGIAFALDRTALSSILLSFPETRDDDLAAFASGSLTVDVVGPVERLLGLLEAPADIPVLAPLFERELLYRLAQGSFGGVLRRAARQQSCFSQIRAATDWIQTHADEPMRVDELASRVGMSPTSFYRHFRAVTGTSPLAFQRHIRLLAAQRRILSDGYTVTAAAFAGGYASGSQFSREYKKLFGVSPAHDKLRFGDTARRVPEIT